MPHELYPQVAIRARHHCEYCRAPEEFHSTEFEVEHIQPQSLGGDDSLENLALACRSCNVRKLQATRALDPMTGTFVQLFNPRLHIWAQHFTFIRETGQIFGRTPTGRATVRRLDLNRSHVLRARRRWVMSGWLPT
jgi:hypothetical protein